jgi:hypothetical protein
MPVPSNLSDLSPIAANNSPASTDTLSSTDDYLRALSAILAKISDGTDPLVSPTISFGTGITFEGATANDFETTVAVTDPTADRTVTIPDATGTVLLNGDIGVSVQAYDADTAKLDVDQTWTGAQRGTVTTDNDLSFDLAAGNNFFCTPTAGGALTFTNITAGQSGNIFIANTSNYAITAGTGTWVSSSLLSTISASGSYWLSYWSPNGTIVVLSTTGALQP